MEAVDSGSGGAGRAGLVLATGTPGLHKTLGLPQGGGPEISSLQQAHTPLPCLQQPRLQQAPGRTTEGDSGAGGQPMAPAGTGQLEPGAGIGTARQLQGARWCHGRHPFKEPHGRSGRADADVAAHGPAIQLPEGPQAMVPKGGEPLPEGGRQKRRRGALARATGPLETAAHGEPPQGHSGCHDLVETLAEGQLPAWTGVQLDRIGGEGHENGGHGGCAEDLAPLPDQAVGAGRQTAAAAIAAIREHTGSTGGGNTDRQGRTHALTGPGAVGRTAIRGKPGLAEMGILPVAEADHQPGPPGSAGLSPGHATAGRIGHANVCRHVDAVNAGKAVETRQILDRLQVLVAGSGDPLDPTPGLQGPFRLLGGLRAQEICSRGCQRSSRAPPISTTIRRRGQRRVRATSEVRSAALSTCPSRSQSRIGASPSSRAPSWGIT